MHYIAYQLTEKMKQTHE